MNPAWAQQTLHVTIGQFVVYGDGARAESDILVENRKSLTFDLGSFNGPRVGGDWLIRAREHLEVGIGAGFSRQSVPTVYTRFVDPEGQDIAQTHTLRSIPISVTARFLPFGYSSKLEPYVGSGIVIHSWRYAASGEFVDEHSRSIFRDETVADGTAVGGVVVGGLRVAFGRVIAGGEVHYERATSDLENGPADATIDLGGFLYQFTIGFRFGS